MGILDGLFSSSSGETGSPWGNIIAATVPSIIQAGAGYLQSDIQQEQAEDKYNQQLALSREQQAMELKLAALKARYSSGGGSGGSGIDPNKLTKAQHVAAVQNQGDTEQNAIANLIASMQNAYGMSTRG